MQCRAFAETFINLICFAKKFLIYIKKFSFASHENFKKAKKNIFENFPQN